MPEQGGILGGIHPRAVDEHHGGPRFSAVLQLGGVVGHKLLPVLRGLGLDQLDLIGPHGQVFGLQHPAAVHRLRIVVGHKGPPGQPEQESRDEEDQHQKHDAGDFQKG